MHSISNGRRLPSKAASIATRSSPPTARCSRLSALTPPGFEPLAALATGVGPRALLAGIVPDALALLAATVLIGFSVFCLWAGVWRELHPGATSAHPNVRKLSNIVLIVVNLILAIVAIAALIGVWSVEPPWLSPPVRPDTGVTSPHEAV